jgi:hypothetical protein
VTEHDNLVFTGLLFIWKKTASQGGPQAQDVEKRGGDTVTAEAFGPSVTRKVHVGSVLDQAQSLERRAVFLPIREHTASDVILRLPRAAGIFPQVHELAGLFVGERFEYYTVDDAEDGGVRPDAEREREHGHGGEARVLQQLAESEFEIIHSSLNRDSLNR